MRARQLSGFPTAIEDDGEDEPLGRQQPTAPGRSARGGDRANGASRWAKQHLTVGADWLSPVRSNCQSSGSSSPSSSITMPSRKLDSCLARTGCRSFRTAFASICRTRSRVTRKIRPTSSSV